MKGRRVNGKKVKGRRKKGERKKGDGLIEKKGGRKKEEINLHP